MGSQCSLSYSGNPGCSLSIWKQQLSKKPKRNKIKQEEDWNDYCSLTSSGMGKSHRQKQEEAKHNTTDSERQEEHENKGNWVEN
jgi:hypothetical protein